MAQWVLKFNGQVVPRRTCRPLRTDELNNPVEIRHRKRFDEQIEGRFGSLVNPHKINIKMARNPENIENEFQEDFVPYEDGYEKQIIIPETHESEDS